MLYEGDKVLAKLCIDRKLITDDQLNDAVFVQEKLVTLGIKKKLGEVMLDKGYLKREQYDVVTRTLAYQEQRRIDQIYIKLALEQRLVPQAEIEKALGSQKRQAETKPGEIPSVGEMLVQAKVISAAQHDSVKKNQHQIRLQREGVSCPHCGSFMIPKDLACSSCGNVVVLEFKPEAAAKVVGYFVHDPQNPDSPEYLVSMAVLRTWIQSHAISKAFEVRPEDQAEWIAIGELDAFRDAFDDVVVQSIEPRIKKKSSLPIVIVALVVLAIGLGAGGFFAGQASAPKRPRGGPSDVGSNNVASAGNNVGGNGAGAATNNVAPANNAGQNVTAPPVDLQDLLRRQSNLSGPEAAQMMALLGYGKAMSPMLKVERWLPEQEARELRHWGNNLELFGDGLLLMEADGQRMWVYIDPDLDIAEAAGSEVPVTRYVLTGDAGAREEQLFPRTFVVAQRYVWREYLARIEALGPQPWTPDKWLTLVDYCVDAGWPIEARLDLVEAYLADLQDDGQVRPALRDALMFVMPGENPNSPTRTELFPPNVRAMLPAPPQPDVAESGAPVAVRPTPQSPPAPPWLDLVPPYSPADLVPAAEPGTDPEADRLAAGEKRVMGVWYPREAFERFAATRMTPQRAALRPDESAVVWTNLPQVRPDVFDAVGAIADACQPWLRAQLASIAPALAQVGEPALPYALALVAVDDANELLARPGWVPATEAGLSVRPVAIGDARDLEALIEPVSRALFAQWVHYLIATSRASAQPDDAYTAPSWAVEGLAAELSMRFLDVRNLAILRTLESARRAEWLVADDADVRVPTVGAMLDTTAAQPTAFAYSWVYLRQSLARSPVRVASLFDKLARESSSEIRRYIQLTFSRQEDAWRAMLGDERQQLDTALSQNLVLDPTRIAFITPVLAQAAQGTPARFYSAVVAHWSAQVFSRAQLLAVAGLATQLRHLELSRRRSPNQRLSQAAAARRDALSAVLNQAGKRTWTDWLDSTYGTNR